MTKKEFNQISLKIFNALKTLRDGLGETGEVTTYKEMVEFTGLNAFMLTSLYKDNVIIRIRRANSKRFKYKFNIKSKDLTLHTAERAYSSFLRKYGENYTKNPFVTTNHPKSQQQKKSTPNENFNIATIFVKQNGDLQINVNIELYKQAKFFNAEEVYFNKLLKRIKTQFK